MSDSDQGSPTDGESAEVAAIIAGGDATTAVSDDALAALQPELIADSISEYFRAWGRRLRNGESGALPIVVGLIIILIFFQIEQSEFLTAGNLVDLFVQSSIYIVFGAAELWALLLSEIDLSVGFAAAVAAFIVAELNQQPVDLPWWVGVIAGVGFTTLFGVFQGTLITRLNLPSFVVTLAGLLTMEGLMLELANIDPTALGGDIDIPGASPVYKLASTEMSVALGWIVLVVALAVFAALTLRRAFVKRRNRLAAPPLGVTLLTIAITAIGGLALVLICNANTPAGVPWVVPFVLVLILITSFMLGRMRFGRYVYAIGANAEAARRAGINVALVRTATFGLVGLLAGVAGIVYASQLGSISTAIDGGNYVLFAVAAAVIGGASLFGGRGKPLHALLGGLVIAVVFNGLGLMGVGAAVTEIVTAAVLIAAVTVDSLVRRRAIVSA